MWERATHVNGMGGVYVWGEGGGSGEVACVCGGGEARDSLEGSRCSHFLDSRGDLNQSHWRGLVKGQ